MSTVNDPSYKMHRTEAKGRSCVICSARFYARDLCRRCYNRVRARVHRHDSLGFDAELQAEILNATGGDS